MPELPEVEVLAAPFAPVDSRENHSRCERAARKSAEADFAAKIPRTLLGAKFTGLSRRGKYLLFQLCAPGRKEPVTLLGHLGMTGRFFSGAEKRSRLPRHAAVVLDLGGENFIYEDTRYFGRLTLNISAVEKLGRSRWAMTFSRRRLRSRLNVPAGPSRSGC